MNKNDEYYIGQRVLLENHRIVIINSLYYGRSDKLKTVSVLFDGEGGSCYYNCPAKDIKPLPNNQL